MSNEPVEIAVAVVEWDGHVLVGLRGADVVLAGKSEFRGGKGQARETPAGAARRECREETGLDVIILRPLDIVTHAYDHGTLRIHFFAAEPTEPTMSPRAPFRWTPRSALATHTFPAANQALVARLLRGE